MGKTCKIQFRKKLGRIKNLIWKKLRNKYWYYLIYTIKYIYARNSRTLQVIINDKDSFGERQMNKPKCQNDTYHNATKICICNSQFNKVC